MTVLIGYTSYNRLGRTQATLPVLLDWARRTNADARVVVVDDCSTDGSREWLRAKWEAEKRDYSPWWLALVMMTERRGNAACSNTAWRMTNGDYIKFDNDVVILRDDWLTTLKYVASRVPQAAVIAHNCEAGLAEPYPEVAMGGLRVALPNREYGTVAGACALIPKRALERIGRWNEGELNQTFNRGLDLVYSVRVKLAGMIEIYTSGERNKWVRCIFTKEPPGYAQERHAMKRAMPAWAMPVISDYQNGQRAINDRR